MAIQSFQVFYWKDHPFSPKMLIFLCQRSVDSMCVGSYLGSLPNSYLYIPLQIPYYEVETQIQIYNEIPSQGCYTHLFRSPLGGHRVHPLK